MNDLSETINKAADLVHRLTGPVCDDIGAMISDSMKPYRARNLVNTLGSVDVHGESLRNRIDWI
jgi:hypothetical protein